MKISRKKRIIVFNGFISAVTTAVMSFSTLIAPQVDFDSNVAGQNYIVNQGQGVYTQEASCTLSYIGDDFAITAAHCGEINDNVYLDHDAERVIGTISDMVYRDNYDVAIISLRDNVLGANIHSGNSVLSTDEVAEDDLICQYGMTSQKTFCTKEYGFGTGGHIWTSAEAMPGDSGGPVWVDGKGYIGAISTTINTETPTVTITKTGVSSVWRIFLDYDLPTPLPNE